MADTKENPKNAEELSQEELTAKRDEITKYYKDHIPHLEAQLNYENLLRDIEKTRAERMQAQMFMTKMAATPPEPTAGAAPKAPQFSPEQIKSFEAAKAKVPSSTNLTPVPETKKRTLKKTESNE